MSNKQTELILHRELKTLDLDNLFESINDSYEHAKNFQDQYIGICGLNPLIMEDIISKIGDIIDILVGYNPYIDYIPKPPPTESDEEKEKEAEELVNSLNIQTPPRRIPGCKCKLTNTDKVHRYDCPTNPNKH